MVNVGKVKVRRSRSSRNMTSRSRSFAERATTAPDSDSDDVPLSKEAQDGPNLINVLRDEAELFLLAGKCEEALESYRKVASLTVFVK